jgi:hypothetical protein
MTEGVERSGARRLMGMAANDVKWGGLELGMLPSSAGLEGSDGD